jgi:hypothetical protein
MRRHRNAQAVREAVPKVEVAEAWAPLRAVLVLEALVGVGAVEAAAEVQKAPAIPAASVKASLAEAAEVQEVLAIQAGSVSRNLAVVGHIVNHPVLLGRSILGPLESLIVRINGNEKSLFWLVEQRLHPLL